MQQPRPGGLRSKWAGGCLCPLAFLKNSFQLMFQLGTEFVLMFGFDLFVSLS